MPRDGVPTAEERERQARLERAGLRPHPYTDAEPERAEAYVHPVTGESGLTVPPFVENGEPPPSTVPWGIPDPEE